MEAQPKDKQGVKDAERKAEDVTICIATPRRSKEGAEEANQEEDGSSQLGLSTAPLPTSSAAPASTEGQPGAYRAGFGTEPRRLADIAFSSVGVRTDEEEKEEVRLQPVQQLRVDPQQDTAGLVVANPVQGSDDNTATQGTAQAVDLDNKNKAAENRHRKEIIGVVSISLIGIIGVILLVVLLVVIPGREKDDKTLQIQSNNQTEIPTSPPTLSVSDQILNLFPENTVQTIQRDTDLFLPQSKAYQWLLDDPYLQKYTGSRLIQRFALATLYYATTPISGIGWTNASGWMDYDVHECDWKFFWISPFLNSEMQYNVNLKGPCYESDQDEDPGEIYRHLGLPGNNLQGSIPEEVYLLTSLKSFLLDANPLSGTLSTRIGDLSANLEFLSVAPVASLSGTIPSQLGLCRGLKNVYLFTNPLTGTMPTEMGLLTKLERLGLFQTLMTGTIPEQFAPPKAVNLFLAFNQFSGTLSSGLVSSTDLMRLIIRNNQFSGSVPTEIGMVKQLWQLALNANFLTGTIPSELASLVTNGSLLFANLTANGFSGTVPQGLCLLETLEWQNRSALPNVVVASPVYLAHDCSDDLCGCNCTCA